MLGTGQQEEAVDRLPDPGSAAARSLLRQAQDLSGAIGEAVGAPQARRADAQRAYASIQAEAARDELASMPVDRIKEVTRGRLMLTALQKAGFDTVGEVLAAGPSALDRVPGVGPQTAAQVVAAARQIEAALAGTVTARIDPDRRTIAQGSCSKPCTATRKRRRTSRRTRPTRRR